MSTNRYFKSNHAGKADQFLVQSLIIESIKIHGKDFFYIPREFVAMDKLYGEDKLSAFTNAYPLEFYVDSIQQFGGDNEFISKFGLEMRDEIDLVVAVRRFQAEVTSKKPAITRPREGDMLFIPMVSIPDQGDILPPKDNGIWEISYVKDTDIFFQLGNLFTYKITCKRFEVSGETFDTGIEDVDSSVTNYQLTKVLVMTTGVGDFVAGETVYQGADLNTATFKGTVVSWDMPELILMKVSGQELETESVVGQTSGAQWTFDSDITLDSDADILMNDAETVKIESETFTDDDEVNPYGGQ